MGKKLNLTNKTFNRLRVIKEAAPRREGGNNRLRSYWFCYCDPVLGGCNNYIEVRVDQLKDGTTQSCGCLGRERLLEHATDSIHGHSRRNKQTSEYLIHSSMIQRCTNPNNTRYKDYGGRGITVCLRWLQGESNLTGFECFYLDMGARPSKNHSINRIFNDEGYYGGNCEWANREQQSQNTRRNVVGAEDVIHIRQMYSNGKTPKQLQQETGLYPSTLNDIIYFNTWKNF